MENEAIRINGYPDWNLVIDDYSVVVVPGQPRMNKKLADMACRGVYEQFKAMRDIPEEDVLELFEKNWSRAYPRLKGHIYVKAYIEDRSDDYGLFFWQAINGARLPFSWGYGIVRRVCQTQN